KGSRNGEDIARPSSRPVTDGIGSCITKHRHIDHPLRCANEIPSHESNTRLFGSGKQALIQVADMRVLGIEGAAQTDEKEATAAAHRIHVAQVDSQCFGSDCLKRSGGKQKMCSFYKHVRGNKQSLLWSALKDGSIVTDANDHFLVRRRGKRRDELKPICLEI